MSIGDWIEVSNVQCLFCYRKIIGVTMNLEKSLRVVQKHLPVKFSMDGGVTLGIIPTMIDEVFVRAFLWEER